MPRSPLAELTSHAAARQEIPEPTFGQVDEAVLRGVLGEKEAQILLLKSFVASCQQTIAALRAQLEPSENGEG
jgi:hypothetical protein